MNTKKILTMLFVFSSVLCILLVSCTKDIKVGLLMDNYLSDRWKKDQELFVNRVNALGGSVVTEVAEANASRQLEQAKKMVDDGVDVLVVVPVNSNLAGEIVNYAHQHNVRVLSYDRLIRNCDLDFYISFDNIEVGRLQAEYLTVMKPEGNYAIIGGPSTDNNSYMIKLGQMLILSPLVEKGSIKLVYDVFADNWTSENGYKNTLEIIKQSPDIDVILAANDDLAKGVIKALEENQLAGKVLVSGQDADLEACQRIIKGTQTMTVYKPIEALASKAAEIAVSLANGEIPASVNLTVNNGKGLIPSVLLPPMTVNKGTIDLTVVADGYLEENNIYNK